MTLDQPFWSLALAATLVGCSAADSVPRLGDTGGAGSAGSAGYAGAAGQSGTAGASQGGLPTSCREPAPTCGTPDFGPCCAVAAIPGGAFVRGAHSADQDPWTGPAPATISSFGMDVYEITVGRFRRFVDPYPASRPLVGAGGHPKYPASGWQDSWPMAAGQAELRQALAGKCAEPTTWTDLPAANEQKPITCLTWYEMFAFCAWDGGRLPTEAEWEFAAVGGEEQRLYPWSTPASSDMITPAHAVVEEVMFAEQVLPEPVGSKPLGRSRWGQADLIGNAMEWTHDAYLALLSPCVDCLRMTAPKGIARVARGAGSGTAASHAEYRWQGLEFKDGTRLSIGGRCVRQPPFE